MEKEAELASKYRDRAKERRAHHDNEDGEGAKENSDKVGFRMCLIVTNTFERGIGRGMLSEVRISAILRRTTYKRGQVGATRGMRPRGRSRERTYRIEAINLKSHPRNGALLRSYVVDNQIHLCFSRVLDLRMVFE